jgi:hypothetical protein
MGLAAATPVVYAGCITYQRSVLNGVYTPSGILYYAQEMIDNPTSSNIKNMAWGEHFQLCI